MMRDPTFQDAYTRVRSRYNDQDWLTLPPREITDLIYREMREIDLHRAIDTNSETKDSLAAG